MVVPASVGRMTYARVPSGLIAKKFDAFRPVPLALGLVNRDTTAPVTLFAMSRNPPWVSSKKIGDATTWLKGLDVLPPKVESPE